MSEHNYDVAVVGAGAAGSMGVLRSVLNNLNVICFTGNALTKKRARATWVGKVENMPVLFDRPKAVFSSANEVFQWINKHEIWSENLNTIKDTVEKISGKKGSFSIQTSKGESFHAKYILLCTGIMDVQPEIQGNIKNIFPMANMGYIEYCIRCDGHKTKGKNTVIIGHTEPAPWIASLLKERYNNPSMTILTSGHPLELPSDSPVRDRLSCYQIDIHTSPIKEIHGNPKDEGLTGFTLADGTYIKAEIAFVSLGTIVYNQLAKDLGCKVDERGYVLTDKNGETNVEGVFIGGDLRANKKKQIYTAWDITVDAADKIDQYIRAEKREKLLTGCQHGEEVQGSLM